MSKKMKMTRSGRTSSSETKPSEGSNVDKVARRVVRASSKTRKRSDGVGHDLRNERLLRNQRFLARVRSSQRGGSLLRGDATLPGTSAIPAGVAGEGEQGAARGREVEERSEEAEGPQSSRIVRGDEGPAPDAATRGEVGGESPTVVVVGRVDVSLRHHHERLLRASASSAVDAVAAEEGAFAIFEAHASRSEIAARDVVRTAPGDGYGEVLRRRLDHALYCRYDEVLAATVVDQLVAALRVVEAKVDLFVRDYGSVVRELGALVAYDFVKAMDDDYRQSGGDSIWRKFLGLLTRRGVVVALLNEVLVPEEVGGHARRPTYRGDAAYLLRLEEVVLQDVRRPAEWRQAARAAVRELAQRLVDADAKGCDEQEGGP